MLPECAVRLRNAVVNGQSAEETKLFSDDEIIVVNNHKHNCFSPIQICFFLESRIFHRLSFNRFNKCLWRTFEIMYINAYTMYKKTNNITIDDKSFSFIS